MKEYLRILKNVLENGQSKQPVRRGPNGEIVTVENGTIGTFCEIFRHNMSDGFPLITTKKMAFKSIRVELEFFIKGLTDKKWLQDRGCKIWDEWSSPVGIPNNLSKEQKLVWQKSNRDLGPLGYSHGWRNFGGDYKPVANIVTMFNKTITIINNHHKLCGETIDGKYGNYTVISYDGKDQYLNDRFTVQFHTSGFIKNNLCKKQIMDKSVFDPYFPNICGLACIGQYDKIPINVHHLEDKIAITDSLKSQWRQMIHRCFNISNKAYKNYGAKDIYVDNRWLIFENFLQDVQELNGWENKLSDWDNYELDKDYKNLGYYSKDTCIWIHRNDNVNLTLQQYTFDAIDPDGNKYIDQIGLNRFCKEHNLSTKTVEASISNNTQTHNGWKFIRKENIELKRGFNKGTDQLLNIVNQLKSNPYDRRMVCNAWNPNDLNKVALPSCHYEWNVVVYNNKLNLVWSQRSVDTVLGLPFNIASYGLLLLLLSKESGLEPGELVGNLHDCHIYNNHIEQAKLQLTRIPYELPKVSIVPMDGRDFSIFNWTWEDVVIAEYNHHPAIKAEVTV